MLHLGPAMDKIPCRRLMEDNNEEPIGWWSKGARTSAWGDPFQI